MEKSATVLARMRGLQEQISSLQNEAKDQLLQTIQDCIAELSKLGFAYKLVSAQGRAAGTRRKNPDRPCPICEFVTSPPHDARTHRGQSKKKPFTAAELKELGLSRQSR